MALISCYIERAYYSYIERKEVCARARENLKIYYKSSLYIYKCVGEVVGARVVYILYTGWSRMRVFFLMTSEAGIGVECGAGLYF